MIDVYTINTVQEHNMLFTDASLKLKEVKYESINAVHHVLDTMEIVYL